jgi:uncharacterized membrane protein
VIRRHRLLPALGLVLVVAIVCWRTATLLRYDLWYDELYSVYAASGDLGEVWQSALSDRVHPPLFYLILWGWLQAADFTPTALRLLPLLCYVGALGTTWWAAGAARLSATGRWIAVLAVALNPIVFDAGADLRGYALLGGLIALMVGATLHLLDESPPARARWILIGSAILATWVHYFAWPTVAALVVILLWYGRRRDAALLGGASVAASLPWAWALLDASAKTVATQLAWSQAPGLTDWLLLPGSLLAGRTPTGVQVAVAIAGWVVLGLAAHFAARRPLVLLVASPPLAALLGGLALGVGIWDSRYLIGATIPFALLLAHAASGPARIPRVGVAIVLLMSAWGAATPADWRIPWRGITQQLAAHPAGGPVYVFDGFSALPIRYYALMEGLELQVPEVKTWPGPGTTPGWLVVQPATFPDTPDVGARLRAAGLTVTDSVLSGVGTNRIEAWRFR